MEAKMLGLISYLSFLGLLALVMRVAVRSGRDRSTANAAAVMLAARVH